MQDGLPALPAGLLLHMPVAHVPQGPHAESQQIPPTQKLDWHWLFPAQMAPCASFGTQAPETLHQSAAMQPVSAEQVAGHDGLVPEQR